ncbi:MAG TPA: alcohol dehydrogenase catalytic domain-containing protein [Thermoplasmata archaeon]|nr:alcohol dehydrogenase catalytic domain-containing protein [Thermoplasmata archaeon]
MKVGRLRSAGELALEELPAPTAGPGEVVVELAACGVCGTDLEKLRGRYQATGRLGHEPVGVVREVGEGVPKDLQGRRVFVHHHVPCYRCEVCRRGAFTYCPEYGASNIDPGGFAERFRVPKRNLDAGAVLPLHDGVDWSTGALLEPAACALTALHQLGVPPRPSVFIVGLGPVGVLYARVARAIGARWIGGADLSSKRRSRARSRGFDQVMDPTEPDRLVDEVRRATGGVFVDLAVVATGAPAAIRLGYRLARRGGIVNLFGLPEPGSRLEVDLQELYLRGVRIQPTYATTEPDVIEVQRLASEGHLDLAEVVTDRLPLEAICEAFTLAADPERSLKVLVTGPAYGA